MELQYSDRKRKFRNTAFVISHTRDHFDLAYNAHVMGVRGRSTCGRHVAVTGESANVVDFVRCSYLGLDNHPEIVDGAIAAINSYRSVHWSCARTRLNFDLLHKLEEELNLLFRARTIAFSTVMVANMGALPLIASGHLTKGIKPVVAFDKTCHVSLAFHKPVVSDETKVVTIPHNDINALEDLCKRERVVAYIADGVYSMGGSAPIMELRRLQEKYNLFLYIDDAHGISIFGDRGEGYARSQFPADLGSSTIIAASLGKGFGASGGVLMLGTKEQEDLFRRYSLPYAFSAAPNLGAVGAALASARIHGTPELQKLQQSLAKRIAYFDARMPTQDQGNLLPIRFVPVGDEEDTVVKTRRILDYGFYTSATFFPTVARGKSGIRVCLTATHDMDELEQLCELLK